MSDDARGAEATFEMDGDSNDIYHMFMGLLAILSIIAMLFLYLLRIFWPDSPVISILWGADSLFCIFFLFDFARSLIRAPVKREYLLWQGVLDLLSSIPALPALRIARIARIGRVARMVRGRGARSIAHEFIERRAESALYVTGLLAMLLLIIGSSLAVTFENNDADANITTGANSFWWAFVTITTVGYGDYFPVTRGGRAVGMIMMTFGIGIFGVLTSFMSSIFLAPKKKDELADQSREDAQRSELEALRRELAEIKQLLQERTPA